MALRAYCLGIEAAKIILSRETQGMDENYFSFGWKNDHNKGRLDMAFSPKCAIFAVVIKKKEKPTKALKK